MVSRALEFNVVRAQELCESRGGHPGLTVLISLKVSVDGKHHERRRKKNVLSNHIGSPQNEQDQRHYSISVTVVFDKADHSEARAAAVISRTSFRLGNRISI